MQYKTTNRATVCSFFYLFVLVRKVNDMKNYYWIILLLVLTGCISNPEDNMGFKVKADVVMKKNDSIQVFYTTNGTIDFNEIQSFWVKVKGANKNQTVVLPMPKDTIPKQIRIDFGRNRAQDDIVLNKIELVYKDKEFEMKGNDIYNYFWLNDGYAVLDKKSGVLKRKVKGQLNGPVLYPNADNLKNKLHELTTGK